MNRLLSSNLFRLRKNTYFGLALISALIGPAYTIINNWYYKKFYEYPLFADEPFIMVAKDYFFVIALTVVIALFIGTEYSDKTIRNKIIIGHSRLSVFIANLVTSVIIAVAMYLVGAIIAFVGIPLLGGFELPIDKLIIQVLFAVVSVSVLAVFVCSITTVIGNRVVSIIVSLLSMIGLQILPPTLWSNIYFYTEDGLLDTFRAKIDLILYDVLPTCQLYQYTSCLEDIPKNIYLFPIYSLALIGIIGAFAVLVFRKKNLK